ncbi:uncharacterized protein LOC105214615 isoform X2 [Zeugodacus cucurbitae]|uniref:uncharacterized protein LOC105214615 isoform X2 n=1 Tax=Zeugodacus cucurbitae TaxID=28588 RepID=UPI0023D8E777|nr:uncharacterized protein LOC105214615 isoform X2 [Zeugodacus cucurbitae]
MNALITYLLCTSAVTLSLAAPQYVDPYVTPLPQFSQLSSTPYTGYPYNPYDTNVGYNRYNPYNPYNPYNRNTGTNTYWNGYAWVNSFRSNVNK